MEHEPGEHEQRELSGVAKSQHLLYVLPHEAAAIPQFLDPLLDRVAGDRDGTQILVITPDADMALDVAADSHRMDAGLAIRAVAVTGSARADRLVREGPPIVAGAPGELLDLLKASALKLEHVAVVVFAWVDSFLAATDEATLGALLGEIPRESARVVVTSELTPAVEDFVERHARRARRVGDVSVERAPSLDLRYLAVSAEGRRRALQRLLDTTNPDRAAIYIRTDDAAQRVQSLLRALGYGDGSAVHTTRGEPVEGGGVLILYELPPSREALRRMAAGVTEVIALAQPRQLGALRALASGGALRPVRFPEAGAQARRREEGVRDELRQLLAEGAPARELLALEPLLEEFDGVELAAAALALLERERVAAAGTARGAAERDSTTETVRVFISAGARDNIAARDLVGAIAGEAGVPGSQIGKIEIRESHSLVEVPAAQAEEVSRRLTGTVIRGRRLQARVDVNRPARERGGRPDDRSRPESGGARGRPDRRGAPPGRPGPGGRERSGRPPRPDRNPRD